jgi:hypothetical protein
MRSAASHSENEQPALPAAHVGERSRELVDLGRIDGPHDLTDLTQVEGGI